MLLSDTFAKNTKHAGPSVGDKHTDGGGMYLQINESRKYWRINYLFVDKRRRLRWAFMPALTLVKAR